jgi:prevent-host-death family protein
MYTISSKIDLISTSELRPNIKKVAKKLKKKDIIVTTNNKPSFVMMDFEKFQKLQKEHEEWQLFLEIQNRKQKKGKKNYTQEEIEKNLGI